MFSMNTRTYERLVGRAPVPAAFGGTGFQPVRRTGKMPVPSRTFQNSSSWACAPPINYEKFMPFLLTLNFSEPALGNRGKFSA
jgi:hypothetical protein